MINKPHPKNDWRPQGGCGETPLVPFNSSNNYTGVWHTVAFPARPLELYGLDQGFGDYQALHRNIAFDDNIVVLGTAGGWEWLDTGSTIVFTKTQITNSSNVFTWRRTLVYDEGSERYPTQVIGINSRYVAVAVPFGRTEGNGTVFLHSRQNLTAPPLKVTPPRPSPDFGTWMQLSGNTLAVNDLQIIPGNLNTILYIYKYNETNATWNLNSPVRLTSRPTSNHDKVNFGVPIQLSGTTFIQNLGSVYNETTQLYQNKVAVFDENIARTGNFTLTQYITAPLGANSQLGGGNLAVYSKEPVGDGFTITIYRRRTSRKGIRRWYIDRIIEINGTLSSGFSSSSDFRVSETGLVIFGRRMGSNETMWCTPESRFRYFVRNKMSGDWVEQKVNVTFACERTLQFEIGNFALHKNTLAVSGQYAQDYLFQYSNNGFVKRTFNFPAVVLLYDLQPA